MKISAALIVKNEEKTLQRCIESIMPICNQIVVVDTGSNDKTPIIAANYGCDLFFNMWNNDFAEARNFAIRHCYNDWIFYIDADEELLVDDELLHILSLRFDDDAGGIIVNINNFLDAKLQTSKKHRFTRLFRNNENIRFKGKIHEQISDSILANGFKIFDSNISINHYGYIGKNADKEIRNKVLLEEDESEDVFTHYHLANTYFSMENYSDALDIYIKINDSVELTQEQQENTKIKIAQIYLKQNNFNDIINLLDFKAEDIDNEGLRLSILGATYLNLQDCFKAKEYYSHPAVNISKLVDPALLKKVNDVFKILNIT
ncbi:MAG: glycosyltransferase family 2 protein [Bacteroidetes bacterium]|nr:glycosyltransferase family 2 protein [Bacteroidota bacterium]